MAQERELLLREGMRILGLQDGAYWASWFVAHWSTLALSGALCAAVARYPFAHSSYALLLLFFWLAAAALLAFAYCLSTLFRRGAAACCCCCCWAGGGGGGGPRD